MDAYVHSPDDPRRTSHTPQTMSPAPALRLLLLAEELLQPLGRTDFPDPGEGATFDPLHFVDRQPQTIGHLTWFRRCAIDQPHPQLHHLAFDFGQTSKHSAEFVAECAGLCIGGRIAAPWAGIRHGAPHGSRLRPGVRESNPEPSTRQRVR